MVCRGSTAGLWRDHSCPQRRPSPADPEATGRRLRCNHAVEFPQRDDHSQMRTGPGCRLSGHCQAVGLDAAFSSGARGAGRASRDPGRCVQRCDWHAQGHWRRADQQPDSTQDILHRFDCRRQLVDASECRSDQAPQPRAGRQCSLRRVRRCGSGTGSDRHHAKQIPERRTDLRLR
ncbi:hypothetical protein D3C76_1103710 [compost metagenome]